jgi:pyruvate kinase
MSTPLSPLSPRPVLAKILATLGPASESPEVVRKLIQAGVAAFRFNFSHGTEAEHDARLKVVRTCAAELGVPIAILGDLPGPKIRVTRVPDPGITLSPGQDVVIDPTVEVARNAMTPVLGCTVATLGRDVLPGHKVLINDGAIRLLAVEREAGDPPGSLRCRVVVGGLVTSRKGINTPMSDLQVPAMTDRDWAWVNWAVERELDFLALSFVRTAEEVLRLRAKLAELAAARKEFDADGNPIAIPVVSKIETPRAIENMEAVVQASDLIMVARGDLGVEMDLAQVPVLQKRLVACADQWGKPCIVATQMLESMINSATPTRAEASDVANAVFDGADALMLSGETAVGRHPALVVETMRRIIASAEAQILETQATASPPKRMIEMHYRTVALAHAAWHAAKDFDAKVIVVWSQNGGAARYLSQTGIRLPILAYSSSVPQTRRMALLRGVFAQQMDPPEKGSLEAWNTRVDADVRARDLAQTGDAVVLLAGRPLGVRGATNTLALHRIGNRKSGFFGDL